MLLGLLIRFHPLSCNSGICILRKTQPCLCAQRGDGRSLAGYWEFPGGKIEAHETPQQALEREIEEELPFSSLKCNIALCCGLGLIVRGARGRVCFGRRVVPFARPMPRPV